MKKSILFILSICCFTLSSAQTLVITNSTANYEEKNYQAVKVIMEPAPKKTKKAFKNWMDDKYDVDLKGMGWFSNSDVLNAEKIKLPKISKRTMDFYVKVIEKEAQTELFVFAALGYDIPLDPVSYPNEFNRLHDLTVEFLNEYLPEYYKNKVEESQDDLADIVENKSDLKDDINDNMKTIEDLRKENKDLRKVLEETNQKLITAEKTVLQSKDELKRVSTKLEQKN